MSDSVDFNSNPFSKALYDLLCDPNYENYMNAFKLLSASDEYQPYSSDLNEAEKLLNNGKYIDADELLRRSMPNLLFSPRAHLMRAHIARKNGDKKYADFELQSAVSISRGILSTGDGSAENPYIVLRVSDEHDILIFLGKEFQTQGLFEKGDKYCDRVVTVNDSEIWFDITAPYSKLSDIINSK